MTEQTLGIISEFMEALGLNYEFMEWTSEPAYEDVSPQSIEFAKNMMDLSLAVDATETYTAIRPIGAEVEGSKIDISSVNEGKNYLINEERAKAYGIIYAPVAEATWENVTLPENLLRKAKEKLYGTFVTLSETYEIKAIDLNLTDETIEALDICEYVPVISRMHKIKGNYLLYKAEIHISEPQNTVYYLGATKRTLSDFNNGNTKPVVQDVPKDVSAFNNDANYVSEEKAEKLLKGYVKTEEVADIVSQYMEQAGTGGGSLETIPQLSYEQTFEFLNSDSEEDIQTDGSVLSYNDTLEFLEGASNEDI